MNQPDFTKCPNWGKGGQYVVVDGKRVRLRQAPEAPAAEPPAEDEAVSADQPAAKPKKGR